MNQANEVKIWSARFADFPLDQKTLSPDEQERAARFKFDRDRIFFIIRRTLLRKVLGDHLSIEPAKIIFNCGPNGKPELPNVHFNASHSNGQILIAIANQPIGVDLEYIRPMEDMNQIAVKFFSPPERALIKNETDFFRIWARKEAFLKTTGEGLSDRLAKIDVTLDSVEGISIQNLSISPDFAAALAIQGGSPKLKFEKLFR